MHLPRFTVPLLVLSASAAFAADAPPKPLTLTSPAFTDGGKLPAEFTCDGASASPPLQWSSAPAGTKSFAITMHHIPGPGDRHVYMVLYNIPANTSTLAKNAKDTGSWGTNTVNGKAEYTPPCSKGPGDKTYTLTVYALSADLKFDKPPTMESLTAAIKDKTLATSAISVTYARPANATAGADPGPPGDQADHDHPDKHHRRGPGGPPELARALQALTLSDAQKTKVDAAVEEFHQKQEAARSELLKQLKAVLDPAQYEKVEASFKRPPPPPPAANGADDDHGPPATK